MSGEQQTASDDAWLRAEVLITAVVVDRVLRIKGVTGSGDMSDMCIDGVDLDTRDSESFEPTDWVGTGAVVPSADSEADWIRHSGQTPTSSTGPSVAFDGTHYLFTEADSHTNEAFILDIGQGLTADADYVFEFWYHLYGSATGTLSVEMSDAPTTATALPCDASGEYALIGCELEECSTPLDIEGYSTTETDMSTGAFNVTGVCAGGYEGTANVTVCQAGGAYVLSGCAEIICSQPSDTSGYASISETNLDLSAGALTVSAACASGYEGAATATACTMSGEYVLGGCTAIVCTRPTVMTGYNVSVETNLDLSSGTFAVSATCASGREGSPSATTCTVHGAEYTLSGCTAIVCTRPAVTTGYSTISETGLDLSSGVVFAVSATCASGWEGMPVAMACAASGEYTLSGCDQIVCTRPSSLVGYDTLIETELNVVTGFVVTSSCAANYQNGAGVAQGAAVVSACTTAGAYSLSGCTAIVCTRPSTAGYNYSAISETGLGLSSGTFVVVVTCALGWQGTAAATQCGTTGVYTLSGCAESFCSMPTANTGFVIVEHQLSLASVFNVTATCAAHYGHPLADGSPDPADLPAVTPCAMSGPYALSGCSLNDACGASEDDCFSQLLSHICVRTGPGTHICMCPNNMHGTAHASANATTAAGCTLCTTQAGCARTTQVCSRAVLNTELACELSGNDDGFYVDIAGTVGACGVGTYQFANNNSMAGQAACLACTSQVGCATDGPQCMPPTTTDPDLRLKFECTSVVSDLYHLVADVPTPNACTSPGTDGYTIAAESLVLGANTFSVAATCAAGWEGRPSANATACTIHGAAYTLSGCTPCGGGRFKAVAGPEQCTDCAGGRFSPAGPHAHVQCTDCAAGKYTNQTGGDNVTICIDCVVGKYIAVTGSNAASDCIDCVIGKYVDVAGSDALTDCIDCVVGKYVDVTGSDQASDCIDCVVGRYVAVAGSDALSDCIGCIAGKYVDVTGSDALSDCIDCMVGKYIDVTGSDALSDCIDCITGKYIDVAGSDAATDCIDCVAGKYIDVTGSDAVSDCIDCIAGKYINVTGSDALTDCIDCVVGKYINTPGSDQASDCIVCVAGKYVNVTGSDAATDCIDCVVGKYIDAIGSDAATDCIDCIAGQYASSAGTPLCTACMSGRFMAANRSGSPSAADCVTCPAGQHYQTATTCSVNSCEAASFSTPDIFFSSVAEGGTDARFIRIFNPTCDDKPLEELAIVYLTQQHWDAAGSVPGSYGAWQPLVRDELSLGTTLAASTYYTLCHPQSSTPSRCDQMWDEMGDGSDAYALARGTRSPGIAWEQQQSNYTVLDWLGDFHGRPPLERTVANTITAGATLVRKPGIARGSEWAVSSGTSPASSQWVMFWSDPLFLDSSVASAPRACAECSSGVLPSGSECSVAATATPTGYTVDNVSGTTVAQLGSLGCAAGYSGAPTISCPDHDGDFGPLTGCGRTPAHPTPCLPPHTSTRTAHHTAFTLKTCMTVTRILSAAPRR